MNSNTVLVYILSIKPRCLRLLIRAPKHMGLPPGKFFSSRTSAEIILRSVAKQSLVILFPGESVANLFSHRTRTSLRVGLN